MSASVIWLRRALLVGVFVALFASVALVAVAGVSADNSNPGVLPPDSNAYGQSYGEWAADWWTWVIETTGVALDDATGEYCDVGQAGKVWYLAGSWVGPVVRDCEIPAGKAIFFPIQNNVWLSSPEDEWFGYPDIPYPGGEAAVRKYLWDSHAGSGGRSAKIDGVEVQDLDDYRVGSSVFYATWPGWATLGPNVDDGWYLLLAPLSEGSHTVEFTGWDGGQDVKYNLTIVDDE